jgi:hypothetical protein
MPITCGTPSGGGTNVEVNSGGTLATANFNGTTPAAGSGNINAAFQVSGANVSAELPYATSSSFGVVEPDNVTTTVSGGVISAVSIPGNSVIQMQVIPPITGQYVVIYPTTVTPVSGSCCATVNAVASPNGTTSGASGTFTYAPGGIGGGGTWGATWAGFTLPSYVVPANVTAVYSFGTFSYQDGDNSGTPSFSFDCGGVGLGMGASSFPWYYTTQLTSLTGSTISSASCPFVWQRSTSTTLTSTFGIGNVGLIVYYTGSAPPANNAIQVAPPLTLANNVLGVDPNSINLLNGNYVVAILPPASTVSGLALLVHDGATASDCSSGGGSTPVLCYSNGTSYSAILNSGGGGTTTHPLTMNNSGSGASSGTTFNGSAAETISYNTIGAQQALTLTTTGSSGAATLSAGALNIPIYSGGSMAYPPGNGIPSVNTAGSAWSVTYPQVPVENYGAVGYTTMAAAISGTDSTTAFQNCATALTSTGGQCLGQALYYKVTGVVNFPSGVGFKGIQPAVPSPSQWTVPPHTDIITTSTTATIFSVAGGSTSTNSTFAKFEDFTLSRSAAPSTSGTSKGLSLSFTYGISVNRVVSQDSNYPFYIHASGAQGVGYIDNSVAQWGSNGFTEASGTYYGFYFDSSDGNANPSFRMHNNAVFNPPGGLIVGTYGAYIKGGAINDFMSWGLETGSTDYGIYVEYTGGGSGATADIHFFGGINDSNGTTAYKVVGLTSAQYGSLEINGGWIGSQGASSCIDIENSFGVTITGVQITCPSAGNAVYINGSTNISVLGNNILHVGNTGVDVNNSTGILVNNNLFGSTGGAVAINATSNSTITNADNAYTGGFSVANMQVDSTSTAGSNSGNGFLVSDSTGYNSLSLNGISTGTGLNGVAAAGPGISDPNQYWNMPTGGIRYTSVNQVATEVTTVNKEFLGSGGVFGIGSASTASTTADTGLSRDSAGVVDVGNGTSGDKSGSMKMTNLTLTGTCSGCGGNTTSTSLTTNVLPKANGANSIINSTVTDNGTTVSTTEPFAVGTPVSGWNLTSYSASGPSNVGAQSGSGTWAFLTTSSGGSPGFIFDSSHNMTFATSTANTGAGYAPFFELLGGTGTLINSGEVMGWGSVSGSTYDTGLSRDSAGVVDVGNGTAGNTSGTVKAATGTFGTAVTVAGNAVCQSTGTNCPSTTNVHIDAATVQPTLFSTNTILGPVFYEPVQVAFKALIVRQSGTISCTGAPTIGFYDLGTSPTTTFGSVAGTVASVGTSTSDGVFITGPTSVNMVAGHYYGYAFSAGTCVTAPTFDITATVQ